MSVSDSITHSSINDTFTVVSWNVKGLGHVIKRGRVFSHLKSLKPDVIFLQETHISVNEQRRLRILKLKYEYNTILNKRVGSLLLKIKQKYFELGDKPEKLLASQLRGERISRNPKLLLKLNFLDMMDKLKANIRNWKLLPLSMIGRINAVKMVALPRFLYLFQNLPIYLPLSFFKQLDLAVLSFVWADKLPRISKAHLQKDLKSGGLGLPVFRHYYWAANARALIFWQWGPPYDDCSSPLWLKIESMSVSQTSLPALSTKHQEHMAARVCV
uniref:Endonuclease/exonuclease/phosphatase domain-containing protein n=1 Tax=Sander lucioperca TaxID=283035 RepID=A0A8C9YXD9_SANLU